jgi:hypothetical protein
MKIKKNILFLISLFLLGCKPNEMLILVQKPTDKELDNLKIVVMLDDLCVYKGKLEYTNIASTYYKIVVKPIKGRHLLRVILEDNNFSFKVYYPEDRFIILAPNYSKSKKNNYVGIFKSDKQLELD